MKGMLVFRTSNCRLESGVAVHIVDMPCSEVFSTPFCLYFISIEWREIEGKFIMSSKETIVWT